VEFVEPELSQAVASVVLAAFERLWLAALYLFRLRLLTLNQ
jgi:hypothetical protein